MAQQADVDFLEVLRANPAVLQSLRALANFAPDQQQQSRAQQRPHTSTTSTFTTPRPATTQPARSFDPQPMYSSAPRGGNNYATQIAGLEAEVESLRDLLAQEQQNHRLARSELRAVLEDKRRLEVQLDEAVKAQHHREEMHKRALDELNLQCTAKIKRNDEANHAVFENWKRTLDIQTKAENHPRPFVKVEMLNAGGSDANLDNDFPLPTKRPRVESETKSSGRGGGSSTLKVVSIPKAQRSQSGPWRTPRTPSMTQADKLSVGSEILSVAAHPHTATTQPMPTSTASLPGSYGGVPMTTMGLPPHHYGAQAGRPPKSPVPMPMTVMPYSDHGRSHAVERVGGGGASEVSSRATSSNVSSVHAPIRPFRRNGNATRSPSPANPSRGPERDRRFILTSVSNEERARIISSIEQLRYRAVVLESDQETPPQEATHVVVRGNPRSMKALCGLVSGKWLVPPEYVYRSLEAGFWLDEVEEGGLRYYPHPLIQHRFMITVPRGDLRTCLEQVIRYGQGEVVQDTKAHGTAEGVVIISKGEDLLAFLGQSTIASHSSAAQ